MDLIQSLEDPEQIRSILRQYLNEELHISFEELKKLYPQLNRHMFYYDTESRPNKSKRSRVMDMKHLKTLCDILKIKLFLKRDKELTAKVIIDLSDAETPKVHIQQLHNGVQMVAEDEVLIVKSLGKLSSLLCKTKRETTLVMRFDYKIEHKPVMKMLANFDKPTKFLVGYVRSKEQYDLLLNESVYYIRSENEEAPKVFNNLPDYLIVYPYQRLKVNNKGKKTFQPPYTIRIFKILKDNTEVNGPASNQVFERWKFKEYNHDHSHSFIYLESEVCNYQINQEAAADTLLRYFHHYRPFEITYSALVSHHAIT